MLRFRPFIRRLIISEEQHIYIYSIIVAKTNNIQIICLHTSVVIFQEKL